jgi:transposase
MKQLSKKQPRKAAAGLMERTVGLDLGDRYSHYCMLAGTGELVEEGRVASTEAALQKQFGGESPMRIALEAGTHSPWVSRLLSGLGHEVNTFRQSMFGCGLTKFKIFLQRASSVVPPATRH